MPETEHAPPALQLPPHAMGDQVEPGLQQGDSPPRGGGVQALKRRRHPRSRLPPLFQPNDAEKYADGASGGVDAGNSIHASAWVPHRLLTVQLAPGERFDLLEEVPGPEEGTIVKGDYFVVHGNEFTLDFDIVDPEGTLLVSQRGEGQGTFQFFAKAGTYTVTLTNPDAWTSRSVTLAWRRGVDTLDPQWDADEAGGTGVMAARVAAITATLDDCQGEQEYFAKRFARNQHTQRSTRYRVLVYTVIEAVVMFVVLGTQIMYLRRLDYNAVGWSAKRGLTRSGHGIV